MAVLQLFTGALEASKPSFASAMNQTLRLLENNAAPHTSILVVEDDARVRGQISEYLRSRDFTVFEAETGDEALSFLDHRASHIDCIFSDVQMPGGCDGIELARWVLTNRPGLPILLTSAEYRSEDLDPMLRPILYVLPKPYRGHAVEAALATQMLQFRQVDVCPRPYVAQTELSPIARG